MKDNKDKITSSEDVKKDSTLGTPDADIKSTTGAVPKIASIPEKPLSDVEQLMETVKAQAADIALLKTIADKKALALYYQRNKGKIPLHMKLRKLNGKVIVGWRTLTDEVDYDPITRRAREDQTLEVAFEDGTKAKMTLVDFNRHFSYVECEKIGSEEENGKVILKLKRLDTGQEYKVNIRFVN